MSIPTPRRFRHGHILLAAAACGLAVLPAQAIEFSQGEISGSLNSTLSTGVGLRMDDPDPKFIGIANGGRAYSTNGDDGNQAFDKHELYAAATKLTSDLTLNWREIGLFLRGSYLYDAKLNSHDYFDRADFAGPPTRTQNADDRRRKTDDVQDHIGSDGNLLDAYLFGDLDLGGRSLSYKLGRQVLNWGESTFIQNGVNSIISGNLNRLRVPGASLEEVYVPVEMAWFGMNLREGVDAELFYQWNWRESVIDASGSFFSTNDFAGIGGERVEVGFGRCPENSAPLTCVFASGGSAAPRAADNLPEDGGQYGGALNLSLPWLNNIAVSLYAMNYHSRLPVSSGIAATTPGVPGTARYLIEYPEDIKLYGVSFNTSVPERWGGFAIQGEYSFKQDQPLQIEDVELLLASLRVGLPNQIDTLGGRPRNAGEYVPGFIRRDVSQVDLSITKIFGPFDAIRSDQFLLLAEAGLTHVHGMPDEDELRLEGPATYTPGNATVAGLAGVPQLTGGYATATSWGYRVLGRLTYNNVLERFNLTPTLFFAHDVKGTSPTPILNFVNDRKQITAALGASFLETWEVELAYTDYFGGGDFNLQQDRDFVSVVLKYSF